MNIWDKYEVVYGEDGYPSAEDFILGETVYDDLTRTIAIIKRISSTKNTIGYWVDNDYLGGGRHPWELTKIKEKYNA